MSYFPIFIDMTDRQVLVVGAGSVASRRVGVLEKFGAAITVIAPNTSEEIRKLADSRKICLIEQTYEEVRDTIWQEKNFFMALAATGQTGTDAGIKEDASSISLCRSRRQRSRRLPVTRAVWLRPELLMRDGVTVCVMVLHRSDGRWRNRRERCLSGHRFRLDLAIRWNL